MDPYIYELKIIRDEKIQNLKALIAVRASRIEKFKRDGVHISTIREWESELEKLKEEYRQILEEEAERE